jgi:hypothetical protein
MALTPFAEGVWTDSGPVNIVGMPLTATMTALRLTNGEILLHSPLAMTAERRAAVEALGSVTHLYAPNTFHHLWLGEWAAAFPAARVHAPAALAKKRSDLRIDRNNGTEPDPAFRDTLDELRIDGFRLHESVLVYRPTGTLIVADLVQNVGRPTETWSKMYTQMMGFYDRVALSKMLRWTAFSDRAAARKSIDELLGKSFESMIFGHGSPLAQGAKPALEGAYSWLTR